MRTGLFALLTFTLLVAGLSAQTLYVTWPDGAELTEGQKCALEWVASGADVVYVVLQGERTPLGAAPRGRFDDVVLSKVPAVQGQASFELPWIDGLSFSIKIKSFDDAGNLICTAAHPYAFRPAVLADRKDDGIYLDLHLKEHQRLYVQKGERITKAYVSSSSENYLWLPAGEHPNKPHDHAGVFKVEQKMRSYRSSLYEVTMPWAMRYHGGHFIHATSRNLYQRLGQPASHGCNRLTRYDAKELFEATPVGTRVEVIGPCEVEAEHPATG